MGKNDEVDVEGQVSSEGEDEVDVVVKGKGGGVGCGSGSGGGEEWPSKLRLAKDVISAGLPSDMTRRRPVDGEGDSRRWRGRRGGGPGVAVDVAVASPDAGEEVVAVAPRREAWWSAARF